MNYFSFCSGRFSPQKRALSSKECTVINRFWLPNKKPLLLLFHLSLPMLLQNRVFWQCCVRKLSSWLLNLLKDSTATYSSRSVLLSQPASRGLSWTHKQLRSYLQLYKQLFQATWIYMYLSKPAFTRVFYSSFFSCCIHCSIKSKYSLGRYFSSCLFFSSLFFFSFFLYLCIWMHITNCTTLQLLCFLSSFCTFYSCICMF